MSFYHTIRDLHDPNIFVMHLGQAVAGFNKKYGRDLRLQENPARQLAISWQRVLSNRYQFESADLEVLLEEIVGEIVGLVVMADARIIRRERMHVAVKTQAEEFATEMIALDFAFEVMRMSLGRKCPPKPNPARFLQVAISLRHSLKDSHQFWHKLGLIAPHPESDAN